MNASDNVKCPVVPETVTIAPSELSNRAKREHDESLLDDALRETFPASDPIAVTVTAVSHTRFPRTCARNR